MADTELIKQKVKNQWNSLGKRDKNVLRFYLQLDEEDLIKRIEQFVEMSEKEENNDRQQSLLHEVKLYRIAYLLKLHQIPVKGGKRKTHRKRHTRKTKTNKNK